MIPRPMRCIKQTDGFGKKFAANPVLCDLPQPRYAQNHGVEVGMGVSVG